MKIQQAPVWDAVAGSADNAREHLPGLAEHFFAAGRKAVKKKSKIKILHEFRLEVKRFRYTLELFRPLYGPALDERLAKLRRVQQSLGAINDCAITRNLILTTDRRKAVLVQELLSLLDRQEKDRVRKFVRYWNEEFAPPEEEKKWVQYLRTFAGRAGRGTDKAGATPDTADFASSGG